MRLVSSPLALLLACPALASASPAPQLQEGEPPAPAAQEDEAEPEEGEKQPDDEKDAKYFAIVGGDVYTGTGSVLRGATVLARNGKISAIGYDLFLPEGTEELDAHGLRVYPGLIALGASTRISTGLLSTEQPVEEPRPEPENEIMAGFGFDGLLPGGGVLANGPELQANEGTEEQKSDIEDTFDPFNSFLVLSLASGITTVQQSNAAVKLKRYEIEGVLLKERHQVALSWSVNNPAGIRALRERFERAASYLRELRAWKERGNKDEKEPSKKGVDTSALRVLSVEALAKFDASEREDLLGIARFAQEYGFRPVIQGCEEGWTVADELGRAGAYAVLTPRSRLPKDERYVRPGGASIENAARLHQAGVQVAVRPENTSVDFIGIAGRDILHLPIEAGFAVRGGLSNEAALAAMTIVPARVLGIDHRVGTLEVGKDCDAIVTDGDVLHYQTFTQYTVVDGELVYDKEKELYFAHIRPRPKKAEPEPEPAAEEPAEEPPPAEEQADESGEKGEDEAQDGEQQD
jgi:imidazolonepropionase-like amidohydrolase